jgi:hypothetical protein
MMRADAAAGRPKKRRSELQGVAGLYWFLLALLLLTFSLSLAYPDQPLVDRYLPNFASEVLGIIITVAFVQRLLQRQERGRRLRASIGAFRRGGRSLSRLLSLWAAVLKGCHQSDEPPRQLERLLGPESTGNLAQFDLRQPCGRGGEHSEDLTWARWLLQEIDQAMGELNRIVVAYGAVLDPAYTEALDELSDDPFISLLRSLIEADAEPQLWRTRMNMNRGHREDYFRHLLATAELHNRLAAEAAVVRSRERAPRTGALGMELPRDYDLKVVVRLEKDWRTAAPAAGTLRVSRG